MKDEKDVALNSRWSIAVTEGEMQVLRVVLEKKIPKLLALESRVQYEREDEGENKGENKSA